MKMKKDIKLYNVLFPFWMLLFFPQLLVFVLPGNFIIDSFVLFISMYLYKIENKMAFYRTNILKIFGFGMLSDIIGSAYMLMMMVCFHIGRMGDELYLTIPALVISAFSIYALHYFITFRKYNIKLRVKIALTFAVVTAPYTFLVSSDWLYK